MSTSTLSFNHFCRIQKPVTHFSCFSFSLKSPFETLKGTYLYDMEIGKCLLNVYLSDFNLLSLQTYIDVLTGCSFAEGQ